MPTTYGTGKLADAIRAALSNPCIDPVEREDHPAVPRWSGVEADYRLWIDHCAGRPGVSPLIDYRWVIEVRHRGETPREHILPWCYRMAMACIANLGVPVVLTEEEGRDGWIRWSRPCSAAEVREIEGVPA
jgi:hypothetical protein